jgi:hypothetical protein
VTNLETRLSDASSLLRGDYETVIALQLPALQRPGQALASQLFFDRPTTGHAAPPACRSQFLAAGSPGEGAGIGAGLLWPAILSLAQCLTARPAKNAPATRPESRRAGQRSPYRSGRSRDWLKSKNPAAPAVRREARGARREAEGDWGSPSRVNPAFEGAGANRQVGRLSECGRGALMRSGSERLGRLGAGAADPTGAAHRHSLQ